MAELLVTHYNLRLMLTDDVQEVFICCSLIHSGLHSQSDIIKNTTKIPNVLFYEVMQYLSSESLR